MTFRCLSVASEREKRRVDRSDVAGMSRKSGRVGSTARAAWLACEAIQSCVFASQEAMEIWCSQWGMDGYRVRTEQEMPWVL